MGPADQNPVRYCQIRTPCSLHCFHLLHSPPVHLLSAYHTRYWPTSSTTGWCYLQSPHASSHRRNTRFCRRENTTVSTTKVRRNGNHCTNPSLPTGVRVLNDSYRKTDNSYPWTTEGLASQLHRGVQVNKIGNTIQTKSRSERNPGRTPLKNVTRGKPHQWHKSRSWCFHLAYYTSYWTKRLPSHKTRILGLHSLAIWMASSSIAIKMRMRRDFQCISCSVLQEGRVRNTAA